MKPVEMALATESLTQSMQPVPELEVAEASPWKPPKPPAWALEVTSPELVIQGSGVGRAKANGNSSVSDTLFSIGTSYEGT